MQNRFNINDKVVALSSTPVEFADRCQPRVKDEVYTVLNVMYCPVCGAQLVNVANAPTEKEYLLCSCKRCRLPTQGYFWTGSEQFAPIDEALTQAVAEENYELACVLRDAL